MSLGSSAHHSAALAAALTLLVAAACAPAGSHTVAPRPSAPSSPAASSAVDPTLFNVVVAPIEGDTGNKVATALVLELAQVDRAVPVALAPAAGLPLEASEVESETTELRIPALLASARARLLVWGTLRGRPPGVPQLFFAVDSPHGARAFVVPGRPWTEIDFLVKLAIMAHAAQADPTRYGGPLGGFVERTEWIFRDSRFQSDGPEGWPTASRWEALYLFGDSLMSVEGRVFRRERLQRSREVLEQALALVPRVTSPARWAATERLLAHVIEDSSPYPSEDGQARVVEAYRGALEATPRSSSPVRWALLEEELGLALGAWPSKDPKVNHAADAVAAMRSAIEEDAREPSPVRRLARKLYLADLLSKLGAHEEASGTPHLLEAISIFQTALPEVAKMHEAEVWADTQSGIGLAQLRLAKRESGTERLEAARSAFTASLTRLDADDAPFKRAVVVAWLGTTLRLLATREHQPPCEALLHHYRAKQVFDPDTSVGAVLNLERVNEEIQEDLKSNPAPTAVACPAIPARLWRALQ